MSWGKLRHGKQRCSKARFGDCLCLPLLGPEHRMVSPSTEHSWAATLSLLLPWTGQSCPWGRELSELRQRKRAGGLLLRKENREGQGGRLAPLALGSLEPVPRGDCPRSSAGQAGRRPFPEAPLATWVLTFGCLAILGQERSSPKDHVSQSPCRLLQEGLILPKSRPSRALPGL